MSFPYIKSTGNGPPHPLPQPCRTNGGRALGAGYPCGGNADRFEARAEHLVVFRFEYDPAGDGIENLVVRRAVRTGPGWEVVESEVSGPYFTGKTPAKRGRYVAVSSG